MCVLEPTSALSFFFAPSLNYSGIQQLALGCCMNIYRSGMLRISANGEPALSLRGKKGGSASVS